MTQFKDKVGKEKEKASVGLYRSEEHTSELQSQSTISYAVFCLKKKTELQSQSTISYAVFCLKQKTEQH